MSPAQEPTEGQIHFLFVSHTSVDAAVYREFVFPAAQQCYLDCHFANYTVAGAKTG